MTSQRNSAHADEQPDSSGGRQDGPESGKPEWSGYVVPDSARAAQAGWRTPDDEDERPAAGADERPDDADAPAPDGRGRHAAPRRRARSEADADAVAATAAADTDADADDDPDGLAGWVGSLTEAVDADTRIAGRRTGELPIVRPDQDPGEAGEGDGGGGEADEGGVADENQSESEPGVEPESENEDGAVSDDVDGVPAFDDDEYRPAGGDEWQPLPQISREELVVRLDGLATALDIGGDDIAAEQAATARHMLNHAGARLRLSADHTVVALAGGTGSGKSSLFNAVSGLEFSRVGITRPTTSSAHACVWGKEGAGELLDWLGVPARHRHSRTSELDRDDSELSGLILLDLPDHDSVRAVHTAEADRLIGATDLLVWVLDPQKYADAAVHHRYLAEMAGYGAVTVAVLNQVDRVEPQELEELLTDLRRLLETESGVHPRVLTTSTLTGQGVRELRDLLTDSVAGRRAAVDRLVADLEGVVEGFDSYRTADGAVPDAVPAADRARLTARLLDACGAEALADSVESSYEQRGFRRVGWPPVRWAGRFRRDPVRAAGMGFLHDSADTGATRPVAPQESEVEKAAVEAADAVGADLPAPWPKRLRAAARGGAGELPEALGEAVASALPENDGPPSWWGIVRGIQYTLTGVAALALIWTVVALVSWFGGGLTGVSFLDSPIFAGLGAAVAAAALLAGWLTSVGCRNLVSVAAAQLRDDTESRCADRVARVAADRVITPLEEEIGRYRSFNSAVTAALGRS